MSVGERNAGAVRQPLVNSAQRVAGVGMRNHRHTGAMPSPLLEIKCVQVRSELMYIAAASAEWGGSITVLIGRAPALVADNIGNRPAEQVG